MYYEEQVIGGVLHFRTSPHGDWCPMSQEQLTERLVKMNAQLAAIEEPEDTCRFDINHPGDAAAGFAPYTDVVRITVESGDPGGDPGQFVDFMHKCLEDWYEGAVVSKV